MPAGDSTPAVKAKKPRNRKVASCMNCQARRVRCERVFPCAACVSRNETHKCVWAAGAVAPRQTRSDDGEVQRLRAEVDRLRRLVDVFVSAHGNSPLSSSFPPHSLPPYASPPLVPIPDAGYVSDLDIQRRATYSAPVTEGFPHPADLSSPAVSPTPTSSSASPTSTRFPHTPSLCSSVSTSPPFTHPPLFASPSFPFCPSSAATSSPCLPPPPQIAAAPSRSARVRSASTLAGCGALTALLEEQASRTARSKQHDLGALRDSSHGEDKRG